jgi:hypothetical protein
MTRTCGGRQKAWEIVYEVLFSTYWMDTIQVGEKSVDIRAAEDRTRKAWYSRKISDISHRLEPMDGKLVRETMTSVSWVQTECFEEKMWR